MCLSYSRKTDEAAVNGTGICSEKIFISGARLAARQTLHFGKSMARGTLPLSPRTPLWPGRGQNSISHQRIEIWGLTSQLNCSWSSKGRIYTYIYIYIYIYIHLFFFFFTGSVKTHTAWWLLCSYEHLSLQLWVQKQGPCYKYPCLLHTHSLTDPNSNSLTVVETKQELLCKALVLYLFIYF